MLAQFLKLFTLIFPVSSQAKLALVCEKETMSRTKFTLALDYFSPIRNIETISNLQPMNGWSTCDFEQARERALYPECVATRCGFFQKADFLSTADYGRLSAGIAKLTRRHAGVFTTIDLHRQSRKISSY
jgi:hypothetical protein